MTIGLRAQDPGAQQDAEAAREKLLKAADQLDNIQANSETTKSAVDGMKADLTKLQADVATLQANNATLTQQLADLQAAFDKSEAAHAKEQKALVDSVAEMIASAKGSSSKSKKKEKAPTAPAAAVSEASSAPATTTTGTAMGASTPSSAPDPTAAADSDPAPVKTQKGYYHIVASGETLTLICNAYREDGVSVSVSDIQKANGLTDKSVLQVGQKLFIPKPGT